MVSGRCRVLSLFVFVAGGLGVACKDTVGPVATRINLNRSAITLDAIGATDQITATVFDQNDDTLAVTVTWTSNTGTVASVDADGVVTAVGNGTAQITASAGNASRSVTVTVAQVASQLVQIGGDGQTGTVGTILPAPLEVQANDRLGNPVSDAVVDFDVTQGNGTVVSPVTTDGAGRGSTLWTLGTTAGVAHQVVASVPNSGATVDFRATATADEPSAIAKVSGDGQSRFANATLRDSIVAAVVDQFGNRLAGHDVTFTVTSGGGAVSPVLVTSGSDGRAAAEWTLGPDLGTQTVEATSGAFPAAVFTAEAVQSEFNIVIRYFGESTPTASQQAAFDAAAERWREMIVGDLEDVTLNVGAGSCEISDLPAFSETIDDLLIFAKVDSIDGAGNIVGQAGPCDIRDSGADVNLPTYGVMIFDEADLANIEANNLLDEVIIHEMGHVIGFGSLWDVFGFLKDPSDPNRGGTEGADTHFDGPQAIAAFDSIGGSGYTGAKVPVENDDSQFGTGSLDTHWRESVFSNELMTPRIDLGSNPISAVTVASLADMTYEVAIGGADSFSLSLAAVLAGPGSSWSIVLENDVLPLPASARRAARAGASRR